MGLGDSIAAMGRGVITIIIGLVMIIGGASGQLVLKGTGSSGALAVVGIVMIGIGIFRIASAAKRDQPPPPPL